MMPAPAISRFGSKRDVEGLGKGYRGSAWVPPLVSVAEEYREEHILARGKAPIFSTHASDIAVSSVAAAMYLRSLRYLVGIFCVMSIFSIPSLIIFWTGSRIQAPTVDALGLGHLSLGNAGPVSRQELLSRAVKLASTSGNATSSSAAASLFPPPLLSAPWAPIASGSLLESTPFFSMSVGSGTTLTLTGGQVAWLVAGCDAFSCLIAIAIALCGIRALKRGMQHDESTRVTASDFSVMVTGLPSTTTAIDLGHHFSRLFALDATATVDHTGALIGHRGAARIPRSPGGGGQTTQNETPTSHQPPPSTSSTRNNSALASSYFSPLSASAAAASDAGSTRQALSIPAQPPPKLVAGAKKSMAQRLLRGLVTDADEDVSFESPLITAIGTNGGSTSNVRREDLASLLGGWVSDVHVVGSFKEASIAAAATGLMAKLKKARALYKMYAPGTVAADGHNIKRQQAAERTVAGLELELTRLREKLEAFQAEESAQSRCTGTAFVTFNSEESMQRCLSAYSAARNLFYQSSHLRFRPQLAASGGSGSDNSKSVPPSSFCCCCCRRGGSDEGASISVQRAPEPADMIYNEINGKCCSIIARRIVTAIVMLVLLAVGLGGMVLGQTYSKLLAQQVPDLNLCNAEVPAAFFGSYEASVSVTAALSEGFGGIVVDTNSGLVTAGVNFSDSWGGGLPANPTSPMLRRPTDAQESAFLDDACPTGAYSVQYRYDFSAVPEEDRNESNSAAAFPSLPVGANSTYFGDDSLRQKQHATSVYYLGSAVAYGAETTSCNPRIAADLSDANASLPPISIYCPDPRKAAAGGMGHCHCAHPTATSTCHTLPCFEAGADWQSLSSSPLSSSSVDSDGSTGTCRSYPSTTMIGCYCSQSLSRYLSKDGINGLTTFLTAEKTLCSAFAGSYVAAQTLVLVSSASSAVVNVLLSIFIPMLVGLEKHSLLSARESAVTVKSAVLQIINTLCTVILVNARTQDGVTVPAALSKLGILNGLYTDLTTSWYVGVGSTLCLSIITSIVIALLMRAISYCLFRCTYGRRHSLAFSTQDEMNEALIGPPLDLTSAYAQIGVLVFACLVCSVGMPILHWIGLLGALCLYASDKFLLLRYYKMQTGGAVGPSLYVFYCIPFALALHCAVGIWALAADAILWSSTLSPSASSTGAAEGGDSGVFSIYRDWLLWLQSFAGADAGGLLLTSIISRLWHANTLPHLAVMMFCVLISLALLLLPMIIGQATALLSQCCFHNSRDEDSQVKRLSILGASRSLLPKVHSAGPSVAAAPGGARASYPSSSSLLGEDDGGGVTAEDFGDFDDRMRTLSSLQKSAILSNLLAKMNPLQVLPRLAWRMLPRVSIIPRTLIIQSAVLRALRGSGLTTATGRSLGKGKGIISPWCSDFCMVFDSGADKRPKLSRALILEGWRLQEVCPFHWHDVNGAAAETDYAILRAASVNLRDFSRKTLGIGGTNGQNYSTAAPIHPEEMSSAAASTRKSGCSCCASARIAPMPSSRGEGDEGEGEDYSGEYQRGEALTAAAAAAAAAEDEEDMDPTAHEATSRSDLQQQQQQHLQQETPFASSSRGNTPTVLRPSPPKEFRNIINPVVLLRKFHAAPDGSLGFPKKTWEVVLDSGIASYDFRKHPLFLSARPLFDEFAPEEDDDDEGEGEGGEENSVPNGGVGECGSDDSSASGGGGVRMSQPPRRSFIAAMYAQPPPSVVVARDSGEDLEGGGGLNEHKQVSRQ